MRNMLLNCLAVILGFLLGTCIVSDLELCVKEAYGEWIGSYPIPRTSCCNENEWLVMAEKNTLR